MLVDRYPPYSQEIHRRFKEERERQVQSLTLAGGSISPDQSRAKTVGSSHAKRMFEISDVLLLAWDFESV
jgi:hypothetical protein